MEHKLSSREKNGDMIEKILKESKTVAIVGLSPNPDKDSHKVAKYLQENGYKIVPIYPKEESILGERVYRSLEEIEGEIDIVDIFRKPEAISKIVDEGIKRGSIKCIWLQLGITNNDAIDRAKSAGIEAIQNRCTKIEHERIYS